jgi:RNA ligase (TIGR02306 family)
MFKFAATDRWYKEAAKLEGDHDISAGRIMSDEGSTFKVPYTKILNITPHNNAERLEVCWVYGFQVIAQKGKFQVGDHVIYIPIDSVLTQPLERTLFPEDAKIKLNKSRVRQIRIRGLASQGMIVDPREVSMFFRTDPVLEEDLKDVLGVKKYDPPQPGFAQVQGKAKNRNKKHEHPLFHKYNGLDNIKWFPDLFQEGEEIVIQEKLHGTNARASKLPYVSNTLWKKVKKFFGLAPKTENCYGSNNVDITAATEYKGFYGEDIYGKTFHGINVFDKLQVGEIVYGEIVGPGIQKNYEYGLKEHKFVLFDVKVLQADGKFKWMTPAEVENYAKERGFDYVPVLYRGPYYRELAYSFTKGNSVYCPAQKVREGIVLKAANEYDREGNKKALKWVSEDYLDDKSNTDFH